MAIRDSLSRVIFRLAYGVAGPNYHKSILCLPGEHVGRALVIDGGYEAGLMDILAIYMKKAYPGRNVHLVDVGANIGTHTIGLAGSTVSALSFEPNPVTAAILRLNLEINRLGSRAEVRELALSDRVARRRLSTPEDNRGKASLDRSHLEGASVDLTTSTLDVQLAGRYGSEDVLLIKIDVEGHEREVVGGAMNTLRDHHCILVLEYNRNEGSQSMLSRLEELGYKPQFQISIPRMSDRPGYRVLSLLGLKDEAIVGPFDRGADYIPAVVFSKDYRAEVDA